MNIIFSDHALLKIKQRNISKDIVIRTVHKPDFIKPSYGLREERYKYYGKNWMKVVVLVNNEQLTVITAHWIAKPKRN